MFLIETPKKKFNAIDVSFGGKHPYVVRTGENNGIRGFITEDEAFLNPANTISFGQDTATIFYQKQAYFTGDKMKILSYKDCCLSEPIALYMLAVMRRAFSLFSWGSSSFNVNILNDVKVNLPITKKGKIDYAFIESRIHELEESRIHELEESRIRELEAYLKVAGIEDCILTQSEMTCLQQINNHRIVLKSFKIGEIFNDYTGRDIIIRETKDGDVPLISHQHNNNGISKYVAPIKGRKIFNHKDTIPLADRGVFLATTQNADFHIGTRVKALSFKDGEKSEAVRLFFVTAINKLQVWFSEYLTNATNSLPGLSIFLPVTTDGFIDFEFMDTYIGAIKKLCILTLKQEIALEHVVYEKAVGLRPVVLDTNIEETKVLFLHEYREGCIPLFSLHAACGDFDSESLPEEEGWVDVSGNGFTPDPKRHFAIHAKGNSMYPMIKDGDICVFEWYNQVGGTREGEIVLAECDGIDEECTIKKYHSVIKRYDDGSWEHEKIELIPLNDEFDTIVLNADSHYRTIGVFKCVLC